ncbi:MAG: hypothetical protein ABWX96_13555 [Propionibacteriaceae bacterium]
MDALATVGELNLHLQRDADPVRAEQALQLASGAVRAFCGWGLSQATETLIAPASGTILLTLPTLSLNNITEIRYRGNVIDFGPLALSWTRRGQLIRLAGWPYHGEVEVDCDHGYPELPDVIKLVVLEQAGRHLSNPEGLVAATVGRVSRTYSGTGSSASARLTELDQRLLERFQI